MLTKEDKKILEHKWKNELYEVKLVKRHQIWEIDGTGLSVGVAMINKLKIDPSIQNILFTTLLIPLK